LESSSPEIQVRVIGADDVVVTAQDIATLDDRFYTAFIVSALLDHNTTTIDNSIIIIIRLLAIRIIITNRVPPKSIRRDTAIIGLDSTS
jgi:hypothetical protein